MHYQVTKLFMIDFEACNVLTPILHQCFLPAINVLFPSCPLFKILALRFDSNKQRLTMVTTRLVYIFSLGVLSFLEGCEIQLCSPRHAIVTQAYTH